MIPKKECGWRQKPRIIFLYYNPGTTVLVTGTSTAAVTCTKCCPGAMPD